MNKFKVGDVVKLKEGLKVGKRIQGLTLYQGMVEDFGESRIIIEVCNFAPHYFLDNGYYYSKNMLELVEK